MSFSFACVGEVRHIWFLVDLYYRVHFKISSKKYFKLHFKGPKKSFPRRPIKRDLETINSSGIRNSEGGQETETFSGPVFTEVGGGGGGHGPLGPLLFKEKQEHLQMASCLISSCNILIKCLIGSNVSNVLLSPIETIKTMTLHRSQFCSSLSENWWKTVAIKHYKISPLKQFIRT